MDALRSTPPVRLITLVLLVTSLHSHAPPHDLPYDACRRQRVMLIKLAAQPREYRPGVKRCIPLTGHMERPQEESARTTFDNHSGR